MKFFILLILLFAAPYSASAVCVGRAFGEPTDLKSVILRSYKKRLGAFLEKRELTPNHVKSWDFFPATIESEYGLHPQKMVLAFSPPADSSSDDRFSKAIDYVLYFFHGEAYSDSFLGATRKRFRRPVSKWVGSELKSFPAHKIIELPALGWVRDLNPANFNVDSSNKVVIFRLADGRVIRIEPREDNYPLILLQRNTGEKEIDAILNEHHGKTKPALRSFGY